MATSIAMRERSMTSLDAIASVILALEDLNVPYMLVGAFSSNAAGRHDWHNVPILLAGGWLRVRCDSRAKDCAGTVFDTGAAVVTER